MPGISGKEERAWVMTALRTLVGGRVWKTQVPDAINLEQVTSGGVKPYIIVRFSRPSATHQGRNIGSGEKGQPHMVTGSIGVYSGDADIADDVMDEVESRLAGAQPSPTASIITLRGGQSFSQAETTPRPTRLQVATFFRFYINV